MKKHYLAASMVLSTAAAASAASIGVNFSENDGNQPWVTTDGLVGPTSIQAGFFNTTNNPTGAAGLPVRTGSLASGSLTGLVDSNGSATPAAVSWSSSNTWWNSDGTGTNNQNLAVGYLDDGGSGVSITVTGVPYATYKVYGLLASDSGNTYTTLDFLVNGSPVLGGTATAFGNMTTSFNTTTEQWSLLTTTQPGNYWLSADQTGSTLTIQGAPRSGSNRGQYHRLYH